MATPIFSLINRPMGRAVFSALFVILANLVTAEPVQAQLRGRNPLTVLQDNHRQRFHEFAGQLDKLEEFCNDKQLPEAAQTVRERKIPPDLESRSLKALPHEVVPPIPNNLKADERYWQTQLRSVEKDYAQDLYLLSRRALNDGFPGYAFSLVRETALHDPDHSNARKVLGFVRQGNEWVTQFAASEIKKGNVWHEEYGWIPKAHQERYARGERNFNGQWMSKEKESEVRRDFSKAWKVRTDHYEIRTNVSLERGVELGKALEEFHEFFFETFAGFFSTREQMTKLFDGSGKSPAGNQKPYRVHYYRTREEYIDQLQKDFPNIEKTNGVYMTTGRVAHFYDDPDNNNEATMYHEASHQLFFESHGFNRPIGENAHFWIIEGIACYMESFQRKEGSVSIGDPNYIRFAVARINLLQKNYYVPLKQFSTMGMQEFQTAPELAKNYTQASGLARFFMEYDNGRYREALVKHLVQLYSPDSNVRNGAQGLDVLTGVDFEELDRQYAEDLKQQEKAESAQR